MESIFTLAKKFSSNNAKGLELRSACLDRAVVFNTTGNGYDKIRKIYDGYIAEAGKEGRTPDLKLKGIGKSLEITGADTMDFLGRLVFVNDGVREFLEFYNKELPDIGRAEELDMDSKAALLKVNCGDRSFEDFSAGLLPIIEKYDIGIFKK